MIVKFDALDRFEVPQFTVCNPGSVYNNDMPSRIVGILSGTDSEEIILNFNATSELNLRANKISSDDPEVNKYLQTVYKSLQNRRMIFVDNIGYFIITKVSDEYDGNIRYKDITAESCEIEIRNKQLTYIENKTYQFRELLDLIVGTIPLWSIGEVDSAVAEKYRTFEDVSENLNALGFMLENMQEAYECIFVFDCINRIINVYDQNNYVRLTDIQISNEDVIKSINITENSDELFTALSVSSSENVGIQAVNPLGTSVIYNFDYYLSWMSEDLRLRIEEWMSLVNEKEKEYYGLNLSYYNKLTEQSEKTAESETLKTRISMYNKCRDNIVASGNTDEVKKYNEAIAKKCLICTEGNVNKECTICNGEGFIHDTEIEINISEDVNETLAVIDERLAAANAERNTIIKELEALQAELNELRSLITEIQDACDIRAYFTESEYNELSNYIFEGIYTDDYVIITDKMSYDEQFEQMKTLYDRAKSQLLRVSYPTQEFDLDVENFLFEKEFLRWSNQLETGSLINVELEEDDIAALFLSNITVNYDDKKLSMTFGNRFNKYDPKALFNNVLGNIQKSSNSISFIKDVLYPISSGDYDAFKEAVEKSRVLTKNSVLASTNQSVVIDDTGYTGTKVNNDGTVDDRQIKINNNTIVFTDDAWETCKTAIGLITLDNGITTYGINAETVIGEMIVGGELHIYNQDNKDVFSVTDEKIAGVVESVSENENRISALEQTADKIQLSITSISEDKEAESVKTTTGFTFNNKGLHIEQSGSEIINTLNNDGMYVKKIVGDDIEEVLVANAEGVKAIDITVKNFLTVGSHTRFEDFTSENGEERTAAYWV